MKKILAAFLLISAVFISIPTTSKALEPLNNNAPASTNTPASTNSSKNTNTAPKDLNKPVLDFGGQNSTDVLGFIQKFITLMFSLVAGITIIFIIIGGFRLAASGGNQDSIKKGRATITWAIAGLAVALLSFAIIRIVLSLF